MTGDAVILRGGPFDGLSMDRPESRWAKFQVFAVGDDTIAHRYGPTGDPDVWRYLGPARINRASQGTGGAGMDVTLNSPDRPKLTEAQREALLILRDRKKGTARVSRTTGGAFVHWKVARSLLAAGLAAHMDTRYGRIDLERITITPVGREALGE